MARGRRGSWTGFLAWTAVGGCLGLGVSQVGLITVPLGALLAISLVRRRARLEMLGVAEGLASVVAVVGLLSVDDRPCADRPIRLRPGQTDFTCGGFDGRPVLAAGIIAMIVVIAAFWWLSRGARAAIGGPENPFGPGPTKRAR